MSNFIEYEKQYTEIWTADFTFLFKEENKVIVEKGTPGAMLSKDDKWFIREPMEYTASELNDIPCKRIPIQYILNEGYTYKRLINMISTTLINQLIKDESGILKFKITYKKYIGRVNIN